MERDEFIKETFKEFIGDLYNKLDENSKADIEAFFAIRAELTKESDRGCALLAASFLDYKIELLLRSKLCGTKSILDETFGINGAAGSFSAKINLSYSLGLLPKIMFDDIHTLRKIRNKFGHSIEINSFEEKSIKDLAKNLKYHIREIADTRKVFINCVSGIAGFITAQTKKTTPFMEAQIPDMENSIEVHKKIAKVLEEKVKDKLENK